MALTRIQSIGIATGISLTGVTTTQDAKIGTGITLSPDGDVFATGVCTATSFSGDGSALTGIDATQIATLNTSVQTTDTGSNGTVKVTTDGTEALRVDNSQNVLIGDEAGQIGKLSVFNAGSNISAIRHSGNVAGPEIGLNKFRGSRSSPSTVADGDNLGNISWYGYDGTTSEKGAQIDANLNGTVDGSNMTTELKLSTTTGNTLKERVRIFGDTNTCNLKLYNQANTDAAATCEIQANHDIRDSCKIVFGRENADDWSASHNAQYDFLSFFTRAGSAGLTEKLRINSSGQVLIGATASQSVYTASTLQIQGTTAATTTLSLLGQGRSPYLSLGATGGSSLGAVNAVSANDRLGQITFAGADGTDVNTHSCSVSGYVDGSVSSNAVPGRLVFKTSTGASEVERLRITSTGDVLLGTTTVPTSYLGGNTLAVIDDADSGSSCIELGGTTNNNAYNAGSIQFINNANSNGSTPWNAGSKIVHIIRSQIVTSDSNAGDDSGADLVFYRKPEAGSGTEGFRIKSTGDVEVKDGNLVIGTAAHGIDFSVTGNAGGMTTELLDNYEEGTWTATYYPTSSAFGSSVYNLSAASYTRIGNTVHFSFRIRLASASGGGGSLQIAGFPYTFLSGQPQCIGRCWGEGWTSNTPSLINADSSSRAMLYYKSSSTASPTASNRNDLNNGNSYLICTGTYLTD